MIETTDSMNTAHLLIGGNEGNRKLELRQALANIEKSCGRILQQSSVYETAPWGNHDQPNFLNLAISLQTNLKPRELMQEILRIEESMGRKRLEKYGPRTIDIDILFFNECIIDEPGLRIPHPEIPNRRFALVPLDEIASGLIHPLFHKSIHELLSECSDELDVKKI